VVQKAKTNSNTTAKTLQGNIEIDLNTVQLEKDVGSHFVNTVEGAVPFWF